MLVWYLSVDNYEIDIIQSFPIFLLLSIVLRYEKFLIVLRMHLFEMFCGEKFHIQLLMCKKIAIPYQEKQM